MSKVEAPFLQEEKKTYVLTITIYLCLVRFKYIVLHFYCQSQALSNFNDKKGGKNPVKVLKSISSFPKSVWAAKFMHHKVTKPFFFFIDSGIPDNYN